MTTGYRTGALLDRYEFLERLAISCMGKKHIANQKITLPSKFKSIVNRIDAYTKMEHLLINYLVVDSQEKRAFQSLLKENEAILRYLHAQDLYFDGNKHANDTYLGSIAIPLFVLRLSLMQSQIKEGFVKHFFMMLQASFGDYPNQLKIYAKDTISNKATELGLKSKPTEWVGKIRPNSYPIMNTFESDLSNWAESQLVNKSKLTPLISCTNAIYRAGLFVKALRDLNNGFPSYRCVMEKQTKLFNSVANKHTYLTIMQSELNHIDPRDFLSTNKKTYGSSIAHKMLFTHNNTLFAPYYFLQQLKNQLNTGKKINRLNGVFSKIPTTTVENEEYFNSLDNKGYMIRALFSAYLIFAIDALSKFSEEHKSKYTEVLSQIHQEITTSQKKDSTERAIINLLSLLIEEFHNGWNAGETCKELVIFLYCFRINEQSTQPNTGELPERIFWDTNEKEYDEKTKFLHCIGDYNTFISNYSLGSWKVSFLCTPFKRLDDSLKIHFESNQQDLKKSVNAAFKKKREVIVNVLNKTPYKALLTIQEDIVSMKLESYLAQLLPNVMKYILLSDEEQEAILKLLQVQY